LGASEPARITYVRQRVRERGFARCSWTQGSLRQILSRFEDTTTRRLVILGEAGSGKTLLALELVLSVLRNLQASSDDKTRQIPVPVSIGGWDGTSNLREWLVTRLNESYRIRRRTAEKLLDENRILPVLDGLDEAEHGRGSSDVATSV